MIEIIFWLWEILTSVISLHEITPLTVYFLRVDSTWWKICPQGYGGTQMSV